MVIPASLPAGDYSPGRHCHSTLSLATIDCRSLLTHALILLVLLSLSVKMTVRPPGYMQATTSSAGAGTCVPPALTLGRGARLREMLADVSDVSFVIKMS